MLRRLVTRLQAVSTPRTVLAATGLFLLFIFFVLPWMAARSAVYAGEAGIPDTHFVYGTRDLFAMAEAYGPAGRSAYVTARLTFDLVFPVVYTLFLATDTAFALRRTFPPESRLHGLALVALLGMAFDLLENAGLAAVMAAYPLRLEWVAWAAAVFTPVKWALVSLAMALLPASFLAWGLRRAAGRTPPGAGRPSR